MTLRSLSSTTKMDLMFGFLAIVGGIAIARGPQPVLHWALVTGLAIAALTILFSIAAALAAKIDRRCSDDYGFQLMANAAVVGVVATLFISLIWDMDFVAALGIAPPDGRALNGVLLLSWASGYAIYRFRGLNR
ncbi:MAG: hypothetical protein R3E02_01610 [Blastomonas sp.]